VVEDERLLADAIADGLRRHAMAVDVVYDGADALERVGVNDYDVIVLDRDLPTVSGDTVCTSLTEAGSDARILMLTAAAAVAERVAGLGLGADDYLTKPFAFAELVARIQALGRRARPATPLVLERAGIRSAAMASRSRCRARSSRYWPNCCVPTAGWFRRSSYWRRHGTRTSIRLRGWCGTRS